MKFFTRYRLVILWSIVIFSFSSLPSTPAPETWWNFLLKKGAHVTEYAILYWLTYRAMNEKSKRVVRAGTPPSARSEVRTSGGVQRSDRTRANFIGPLLFTLFYAITDEIHQSFVPGRQGRWYDVAIFDTVGAVLSLLLIRRHNRNTRE